MTLRRSAALHLLAFLAAVALTPHRHLNSFEDLLSDGPSDSGFFLQTSAPQNPADGPQWVSARLLEDDQCLACFHNDWAAEPFAALVLTPRFGLVSISPATCAEPALPASIRSSQSRAPPASA